MEEKLIRLFAFEDIVCKIFLERFYLGAAAFSRPSPSLGAQLFLTLPLPFEQPPLSLRPCTFSATRPSKPLRPSARHLLGNPTFETSVALGSAPPWQPDLRNLFGPRLDTFLATRPSKPFRPSARHPLGNLTFETSAALDNAAGRSVFWLPGFNP